MFSVASEHELDIKLTALINLLATWTSMGQQMTIAADDVYDSHDKLGY